MNRDEMKTAVVFDLDSSLADTRHRWHLSPMVDATSTWAKYCAARIGDEPIPGTVAAARLHYPRHRVHICSGSDGSSEGVSRAWLGLHRVPFDEMVLRQPGDEETPNEEIKISHIMDCRARGIDVVLFYEDHRQVAQAIYERTGVPVLGVNPFYPENEAKFQQQKFDGAGGGL